MQKRPLSISTRRLRLIWTYSVISTLRVAIRYNNLGSAWQDLGDAEKAIEHYNKALEIDLKVFGDKHPDTAIDYNNLGAAWQDLGDAEKAIEHFNKALEIFKSVYGNEHSYTKTVQSNLDFIENSQ